MDVKKNNWIRSRSTGFSESIYNWLILNIPIFFGKIFKLILLGVLYYIKKVWNIQARSMTEKETEENPNIVEFNEFLQNNN